MIGRRDFITLLGGAATWRLAAHAQQSERIRRIGVLQGLAANDPEGKDRFDALLHTLQQWGWTDGRNIQIVLTRAVKLMALALPCNNELYAH